MPSTHAIADAGATGGWPGLLSVMAAAGRVPRVAIAREPAGRAVAMRDLILWGYGRATVLGLGLTWLLSYWPSHSFMTRRLWKRHMTAVEAEQSRRGEAGDAAGGATRRGG